MMRIFICLVLTVCLWCTASAQDKALAKAVKNGSPLPTQITVTDSVRASAVLIPRVDARRIFGKEIADNYAVIEVNVGNKSSDAALIVHDIFIDYSRWALRGGPVHLHSQTTPVDDQYQAATKSSHVASEEYRVVRGQLLDAQMWSKRSWTMRLLTLAGNLAGAYAFSINEEGIVKGLNAFSGVFVPGVKEAWPDGTIEQLNRVSDFGYQANKVIPKQGAEVIVCFFPIDRFLTPGFKKLFLKSPALFFAPLQMLVDKTIQKDVANALELGITDYKALRDALPCYLSIAEGVSAGEKPVDYQICLDELGLKETPEQAGVTKITIADITRARAFQALNYLNAVSLNNVTVIIDGVMTVDVATIAARIDGIELDAVTDCGDDKACMWANLVADSGVRTGMIKGSYLTGGSVSIAEATKLGLTELKTISEESNDQELHFSFKLTKPVPPQTLHFKITKPLPGATGTKTVDSVEWLYPVGYAPSAPEIKSVEADKPEKGKLTIKGDGFYDVPGTFPLVVTLNQPDGDKKIVKPISIKSNELVIAIPDEPSGCWTGTVEIGGLPARQDPQSCFCFVVAPSPKLITATLDGKQITVEGEDLINTALCGGPTLSFQVVKGDKKIDAKIRDIIPWTNVLLEAPPTTKDIDETWSVKVLLDGKEVKESGMTALKVKPK